MRRLLQAGLFVLALALVYLAMLPATWLDALLQSASRGTLALTGTTGSLWRGEGKLQALLPSGEVVTLTPIAWQVARSELLALRLHITVRSAKDGKTLLDGVRTPGETRISEASLELPAALLGALSPTLRAAALSGKVNLRVDDMRIGDGHAAGKAKAVWLAAGSRLSRVRPLGTYQLDLNGKGDSLDLRLSTLGGSLTLAGSGRWQLGGKPNFRITATPTESKRQDLAPLLRVLGRETSPGTYLLTIDPTVQAVSG